MAYLEIKDLHKSFKTREILHGVSLKMEQGECLVIIGDSGSGKTTLLRLLTFLETPDSGTISLNGEPLWNGKEKLSRNLIAERRAHFGLVFQGFGLFPQYNVRDNVLLPLRLARERELRKNLRSLPFLNRQRAFRQKKKEQLPSLEKRVDSLLEEFHLEEERQSYPYSLSGGESQRVAIARALALDPEILCFDEPTSALDPRLKNEVASLIIALKKEGRSLIVVTHEIAFASLVADDVVFLENGMIKEQGKATILSAPKSEELRAFLSEGNKDSDERGSSDKKERTG